jgi:hypothetical protein
MSSGKRQRKALDAVGRLLAPGVDVRAYGAGRANARMSTQVTYVIVGFLVLLVVVAVLTQRIYFPGVLLLAFFFSAVKPMRGVAVVDSGVVVLSLKAFDARPKAVLGELPHAVLLPPHIHRVGKRAVQVPLGPDVVKLRAHLYDSLVASLPPSVTTPDPAYGAVSRPTAPGWYPIGDDQYRQAYWNGSVWTDMKRWDGTAWVDAESSRH